jgi:4-amino-4-deoxy-L-arabinose transferase-like glycosyltransferase
LIPSLSSYVVGTAAIAAIVLSLWLGGYWLRRWIVPEFSGALARLAEITIAVALLIISLQLVGSVGLFDSLWITVASILIPLGAAALGYRFAPRGVEPIAAPAVPMWAYLVALGVASWAVAEWSFPTQLSLDQGMFGGDTTWYHMPASARFVQDASIIPLHYTDALRLAVWFYPQTSELMHGGMIALMGSDWLSPLFNMFCLGVAILASWCVGRPYGVGPATLVGAAILLSSGVMIETQPGEGRNDIMAFAFLVAFAAFLINGHQRRAPRTGAVDDKPDPNAPLLDKGPLIIAGIAAGIAISVKVSMLAPVGIIFLGMIFVSGRARWWVTTAWLGISMLLVGGYWYVRAMIYTGGNPVPAIGWGPLKLPQPDQMPLDPRPRFSVADYIADPNIYRYWFFPRLDDAFGILWPLILVMLAVTAAYLVVKSRNKIVRVLAASAIVTAIVYLFTPLTAAGQEGQPRGFFTNTRYLLPGLLLAMTLLPIARPLRTPESRAKTVLIFLTVVYAITVLSTPKWYPSFLPGAVFLTLAIVWAPVGLSWLHEHGKAPRSVIVACVAAIALVAAVWGRGEEVGYAQKHYTRSTLFLQEGGPQVSYDFARDLRNKRIAVAGSGQMLFGQYGFYGVDLSNHVQYIGQEGDRGTYRLIAKCENFVRKINEGDYDFIFTSEFTQDAPESPYRYPVRAWVKDDPAVREVVAEPDITPQPAYVYAVNGRLDPANCENLDPEALDLPPGEDDLPDADEAAREEDG